MKTLKNFKFFFFLFIGVFLFYWVYKFFAGPESLYFISEKKAQLLLVIFAHIPTLFFDSLAWYTLMGNHKLNHKWSFIITWISQASGKFFPTGTITGEFVRVFIGIKKGLTPHNASSSVFADLIIATFSLFLIAFFSLVFVIWKMEDFFKNEYNVYLFFSLGIISFACVILYFFVNLRLLKKLIRIISKKINFFLRKKIIYFLIKLDFSIYQLSKKKGILLKSLIFRLLGWIAGAFEIYVFLWIIGIDAGIGDVILLESFSGVIRAIAFFIPAGIGIQELAFVIIGQYLGFSGTISFSIAMGRRIREVLVGIPAVLAWIYIYRK